LVEPPYARAAPGGTLSVAVLSVAIKEKSENRWWIRNGERWLAVVSPQRVNASV